MVSSTGRNKDRGQEPDTTPLTRVSPLSQNLEHEVIVVPVRRPEVERLQPEDLGESILELGQFAVDPSFVQGGQVGVAPGV